MTPLNESNMLGAWPNPHLDEDPGIARPSASGTALGTRRLSSVVASPLLRAQQAHSRSPNGQAW